MTGRFEVEERLRAVFTEELPIRLVNISEQFQASNANQPKAPARWSYAATLSGELLTYANVVGVDGGLYLSFQVVTLRPSGE